MLSAGIIGPDGFEAVPLNPFDIFDKSAAIAVFGAAEGVNSQFSGRDRVGVAPADGQVRRHRPHDDLRGAGDHELVRLRDGVLQHERSLPLRARPRERAAIGLRATEARDGFHWLTTLVAPVLGTLFMVGAFYLRAADHERYEGIGRFAVEEELSHDLVMSPEFAPIRT